VRVKLPGQRNKLRVQRRVLLSERLASELVELPKPPRLRSLVAEVRDHVIELHRLRQVVHSMFEVGPANGSRPLGSQRNEVAATVFEGISFLGDDVRFLTNTALEEARVFEGRSVDPAVAVEL